MKSVLRLLSILAAAAAIGVLNYASVFVTDRPYTVPLLALLLGIAYLTSTRTLPRVWLPVGFTIAFGIFHFTFAPWYHERNFSSYTHRVNSIHQACFAYASYHEGKFPDGKTSNEAFRQLFIAGIVDDEKLFQDRGNNKVIQDGNIGTQENGFLQALAPGECAYYYVRGLDIDEQRSTELLLFLPTVLTDGNLYMLSYRCNGNSNHDLITDKAIRETPNVKFDDRFFEEYIKEYYGIAPQDILKPEGPLPDLTTIAREQKVNNRLAIAALLTAIWLPFLVIYAIKIRHKPKPLPKAPIPEA